MVRMYVLCSYVLDTCVCYFYVEHYCLGTAAYYVHMCVLLNLRCALAREWTFISQSLLCNCYMHYMHLRIMVMMYMYTVSKGFLNHLHILLYT